MPQARPKRRSISPSGIRSSTGRPCGQCELQIDGVELAEQRQRLGTPEHVARAHDAVAGDGRQQVVDAIELAVAQRRAVGQVGQQLADQRLRVGVLQRLGHGAQQDRARPVARHLEAQPAQHVVGLQRRGRRLADLDRDREQQLLARHLPARVGGAQAREGDPLVGGVLVDQHQLVGRLAHQVGAVHLADVVEAGEEALRLPGLGRRRARRRPAPPAARRRVTVAGAQRQRALRPSARPAPAPPAPTRTGRAASARRAPAVSDRGRLRERPHRAPSSALRSQGARAMAAPTTWRTAA